ncbi:MAG: hemerythrin domain-containing protein [Solirubrobacterales bacterium]
MKRHPDLQSLSRDHHQALVVARRLKHVNDEEANAARAAFIEFWRRHGQLHFRIEEEVLLPGFARVGGAEDPTVTRVLREHAEIRLYALRLQGGEASVQVLRSLGELLTGHVRLEEGELFPAIEAALSPEQLSRMASALATAERNS